MGNFHTLAEVLRSMAANATQGGAAGVVRPLVAGEFATAGVLFSREAAFGLHRQPNHEELIVILEGEADFRVGEEVRRVRAGDFVFVPRDALHGTVAATAHPFALMSIFTPRFDLAKDVVWEDAAQPPRYVLG